MLHGGQGLRGKKVIYERHRHRYKVNPERLSAAGLYFIGKDKEDVCMEIIELKDHPSFVGVQYHPEYLSRVLQPSKPYLGFVSAATATRQNQRCEEDCRWRVRMWKFDVSVRPYGLDIGRRARFAAGRRDRASATCVTGIQLRILVAVER